MARPAFQPTDEHRRLVKILVAGGFPEPDIAKVIGPNGISQSTLRKHFRDELATGRIEYGAKLVARAYHIASQNEDMRAAATMTVFLCKTRLGFKERQDVEVTGKDGGPVQVEGSMPPITIIVDGVTEAAGVTSDGGDGAPG